MTHRYKTSMYVVVLALIAAALTYPFLTKGLPDGHDRSDHLAYQHYFNEQVARGVLYPRWITSMNRGRGGAIFIAQYPLPYCAAWGIGRLTPNHWGVYTETRTQGLAIALAAILGALFTFAWCSAFVDQFSAMCAAIVFVTLPYFLVIDLYMRVAVGEIWAFAMMPLSLYFIEKRATKPRLALAGLALAFALVVLSHLFTAALFVPVLLVYSFYRSHPKQHLIDLATTIASLALGTGIAGFYVLPMLSQSRYFHPDRMLIAYGARLWPLSQMFPYDATLLPNSDPRWKSLRHIALALAVIAIPVIATAWYRVRKQSASLRLLLAVVSIALVGLTILAGHLGTLGSVPGALPLSPLLMQERSQIFLASLLTFEAGIICYWSLRGTGQLRLANFLMGMALVSFVMTTRWSLFVWQFVHPIWDIQFPWRFNVFLALAVAGLAALIFAELRSKPFHMRVFGSVSALVLWALIVVLPAWRGGVHTKFFGTQSVAYQPMLDYGLPTYAQVEVPQSALMVTPSKDGNVDAVVVSGSGEAQVNSVDPAQIAVHIVCESACTTRIGQFYYPAWRATLLPASTAVPLKTSPEGLMMVSLTPGDHDVLFGFNLGWPQPLGAGLSIASLLVAAFIARTKSSKTVPNTGHVTAPVSVFGRC